MDGGILTSWIALSIGFVHALEPGHGKTALFAYLASGKKTWKDGVIISLSSALTHSLAVFFIAFISHYILHQTVNEGNLHSLTHYLSFASGALIITLGVWVIYKARKGEDLHGNCCAHKYDESSGLGHNFLLRYNDQKKLNADLTSQVTNLKFQKPISNNTKKFKGSSGFFASGIIGVATGIIPCPTVIVAYLGGVSTGNSYLGVQSVAYFALGMFLALLSLVMLFNFGGQKIIERLRNHKISDMNWGYLQGGIFIIIGFVTAFLH